MADNGQFEIHEDMIFKLSHKRSPSDVKLRSLEWAIITQLNGTLTVKQIGEILNLTPQETVEHFNRLRDEELLEWVGMSVNSNAVPREVLDELEYQFTYYVGPVAGILIEDLLTELKVSREHVEKNQLPMMIELLSLEISSEDKRFEFQREMLQKIKGVV